MFALASHYARQKAWSEQTFGPGWRPGVIAHITKETDEVLAAPDDLEEWTDIVILAFDGMWRGTGKATLELADQYGEFPHQEIRNGLTPNICIDAIRGQLLNVQKDPADILSWTLVIDAACDGMRLTKATDEQIVANLIAKQTKNEGRNWPDWRTTPIDQPLEHIK